MTETFDAQLAQLPQIASRIISAAATCPVVLFYGEMGMGKTTLIQEILRQMDIEPEGSPTYGIIKSYWSKEHGEVSHVDVYRIQSDEEAFNAGLAEVIESGDICLIEWPEKIQNFLPEKYLTVRIEMLDPQTRRIAISA